MKHLFFFAMAFLGVSFFAFGAVSVAHAQFGTLPFGGKILTTQAPGITCAFGMGPVVLGTNLASLAGSGSNGVAGAVAGIYQADPYFIPYGTTFRGYPTPGGYILGNYLPIPNFSNCYASFFGGFPFPVKQVTTYGVSGLGL